MKEATITLFLLKNTKTLIGRGWHSIICGFLLFWEVGGAWNQTPATSKGWAYWQIISYRESKTSKLLTFVLLLQSAMLIYPLCFFRLALSHYGVMWWIELCKSARTMGTQHTVDSVQWSPVLSEFFSFVTSKSQIKLCILPYLLNFSLV